MLFLVRLLFDHVSSWYLHKNHDPSEIILICWFDAQETFHFVMNIEKKVGRLIYYFEFWMIALLICN